MNKITKLLSVFILAGAIGTGVAGVAGCNKGGDDSGSGGGGGGTTHTHTYTCTDNEDGATHKAECNATDCDDSADKVILKQAHVDANHDDSCDLCEGDIYATDENTVTEVTITSAKSLKVGETLTLTATVTPSTASAEVEWTIVSGTAATLEDGVLTGVSAGEVTVKATSKVTTTVSATTTIKVTAPSRYDTLKADTANNIIAEDFNDASKYTDGKLSTYSGYSNETPGLYGWGDGADVSAADHYVKVANGQAVHNTSSTNVSIVADLSGKVKDVVEGYVELSADQYGSNWAVMALTGKSDKVANTGEVFAIRSADNSGSIGYRVGGKDNGTITPTNISLKVNTVYEVHFKLDMVSGLITVDITEQDGEGATICENVQTGITELKAVTFVSSNGGKRHTTIDNIAVNSKTLELEDLKVSLGNKVDAYVAAATVDTADADGDTLTLAGENVNTAAAGVKTDIEAATTIADAKAACVMTSIDTKILENAKASAKDLITAMSSDGYTGEALADLNAAKGDANDAIDAAETLADVKAAFVQGKADVKAVENDDARTQADVNITFALSTADGATAYGVLSKKDGEKLTLAEVRAATASNVAANKIVTGIKVDGADVALPYTLAAVNNEETNLTIVIVLSDYANLTAAEGCGVPKDATSSDITGLGTGGFFTLTGCIKSDAESTKIQQGKLQNAACNSGTYTKQIALTSGKVGKYKNDHIGNSISFTVDSACTVTVVVANASGKSAALSVLNADGTDATVTNIKKNGVAATEFEAAPDTKNHAATDEIADTYEFTLEAGTYHIGGNAGGLLVFEISVIYTAAQA